MVRDVGWGVTVIENNIYFSNLLIIIEDHPVVLSQPLPHLLPSLPPPIPPPFLYSPVVCLLPPPTPFTYPSLLISLLLPLCFLPSLFLSFHSLPSSLPNSLPPLYLSSFHSCRCESDRNCRWKDYQTREAVRAWESRESSVTRYAPSLLPLLSHIITLHHVTSHHITSYLITSHHITSHHITSHKIT